MRKPTLLIATLLLAVPARGPGEAPPAEEPAGGEDPPAALGLAATNGAAAGYVPDRACAICHRDIAASYQEVGMARSFYRPASDNLIEDLDGPPFFHAPSNRWYEMSWHDGGLYFRRFRLNPDGQRTAVFERRVDWILGSGNSSRSYVYQTGAGELYQLPVSWYTESGSWGMAPGYDKADHQGVTRRVRRECMFCHNAYPDVPAGSDHPWSPQWFPEDLPEGTGCQRCHGPGAAHARLALAGAITAEERAALGTTIVNPGSLPPAERDSVCLQCHLQPSVAFTGVRRFSRPDYSFRPGEPLVDYLLPVDPEEDGRSRHDRFEINHHPYRLMQSRCWLESEGELSCLSCHDPHRKVPPADRAAHYRAACLGCHGAEVCSREQHGGEADGDDAVDCTGCHMPRRRTEDVVLAAMTDHFIRLQPSDGELLSSRMETDPVIRSVELLPLAGGPAGAEADLYRAVAEVRGHTTARTVDRLVEALLAAPPTELAPWIDLARGQLEVGRLADVERTARWIIGRQPELALAHEWLGLALAGQGRAEEALAALERSLELDARRPEAHFNLGLMLLAGQPAEAAAHLERAVELRPVLVEGWYRLADAYLRLQRREDALAALRQAVTVDPDHTAANGALRVLTREPDGPAP